MPAIKRPNQEVLNRALNVYRDAMRSFIVRSLQSAGDVSLKEAVEASLRENRERRLEEFQRTLRIVRQYDDYEYADEIECALDVNMFSDIICYHDHWERIFGRTFDHEIEKTTENLTEINRTRNDVAHPRLGDIPSDRAENTLRTMARILSKAKAYDEKDEVERILESLMDGLPVPPDVHIPDTPADEISNQRTQQIVRDTIVQVLPHLSTLIAEQKVDEDRLAKQTAERLAGIMPSEQPDPDEIAAAVARYLSPVMESPAATQTAIDAAVIQRLERLTDPAAIADQTAGKMAEAIREQAEKSADAIVQLRREIDRLTQQVTDALAGLQDGPAASSEDVARLLSDRLEGMSRNIVNALESRQTPAARRRPTPVRPSGAATAPVRSEAPSIEDRWKEVSQSLNRTPGRKESSLGGLLRGARPVDIWLDLENDKLVLPFRHEVVLGKLQEELDYPEVKDTIAQAVADGFGRPLEIEPVLLDQ